MDPSGNLDGVTDEMDMAKNEIFGPLYGVLTFQDLDEVLERSNNTDAGLTGYLFTHDSRGHRPGVCRGPGGRRASS